VSKAFSGFIDTISEAGCIEGWAVSNRNTYEVVPVCIVWKGEPIGAGIANLFRSDLLTSGIGHGWHAFRIRTDQAFDGERTLRLSLVELRGKSLIAVADLPRHATLSPEPLDVDSLLDATDLQVTDISSLRLAKPAIDTFISQYGVEEFVDRGYCYILGRPADSGGLTSYTKLIASRMMEPLTFLATLFNSAERRESKWPVLAPSDPGFVFTPEPPR